MAQARAVARRDEIVHAAAAEFDEVGYAAASLSGIAARLGRTKGAMSYHFSSKASIAREVVVLQYQHWGDVVERVRREGYSGLEAMVLLSFIVGGRFRDDVLVRAGIRLQHDAGLHEVDLPTPFVGWNTLTLEFLEEAGSAAKLPDGLDRAGVAEVLVAAFTGLQQVAYRLTRAADIDERVERYWLLLLPSLGVSDAGHLTSRLREQSRRF